MLINRKVFWLLNIPLLGIIGFMGWELVSAGQSRSEIFGEKNVALFKNKHVIFTFGNPESEHGQALISALKPYFIKNTIQRLEALEVNKKYQTENISVDRLTPHITRLKMPGATLFLFGETLEKEELTMIKSHLIDLQSDFWVLKSNQFPDFFPPPTEGILNLNDFRPSKKLETWAAKNKIPLVMAKDTYGFWLEYEEGQWHLRVKK